jgi:hypothetical protein
MNNFNWRIPVGFVILVFGVLALLQSLGLLVLTGSLWLMAFALIFTVSGCVFLYALLVDRQRNWWAAIPGLTLAGLGVMLGLLNFKGIPGTLPVFIFLGSIAASFLVVYAVLRQWWAIIPGGVMASVALMILLEGIPGFQAVSVLFLGMGATFASLSLVGVGQGSGLPWPWIPAGILAFMGLMFLLGSTGLSAIVWAVLLIAAGLFLVLRPYLKK